MGKRHSNALAISDGACNPKAIINSMKAALDELGNVDTQTVLDDPALKLMVHQLAFLQGIPTCEGLDAWNSWRDACTPLPTGFSD